MPDLSELEIHPSYHDNVVALLPRKNRGRARDILRRRGPKSVQLLTRIVTKERRKRRTRAKVMALTGSLLLVGAVVFAARSYSFGGAIPAFGAGGLTLLALSAFTWVPTRLEKAALAALLQSEEAGSLGSLLEGLHLRAYSLQALAKEQLIRLLPQITPGTLKGLTPTQRAYLYGALSYVQRDSNLDLRLSILTALQKAGDESCLGVVYLLATGEALTDTAVVVREAAKNCLEHLSARLDFGPLEGLSHYIVSVRVQIQAEKPDFQIYAKSMLALRQLLPRLTPSNYANILSASHRNQLYRLFMLYSSSAIGLYRYGRRELHLEIVRTAERLGDTRAIDGLQAFSCTSMAAADEELYVAVCKALSTLEPLAETVESSKVSVVRA
jgi:hypothetical protein